MEKTYGEYSTIIIPIEGLGEMLCHIAKPNATVMMVV